MRDGSSNSEKKQVVEHQSYLFDDLIIEEILTRLPIKSILRFKSVSKQWYSTLSSSEFAISHFMKSPFSHPSAPVNTLFITSDDNCYLFSYNDDQISGNFEDNLVKLDVKLEDHFSLTGCCNGLICLTPTSGEYFILWNPATRKMHKYETDVYIKCIAVRVKLRSLHCGFSYVSSTDDYKFVQFVKPSLGTGETNHIVFIFSLRENKWTRFDFDYGADFNIIGHAALTNERLYWSAFVCSVGHIILSFDLGVERFDVIKLERMESLGVMGGCLSKCNPDFGDRFMHIFEAPGVMGKSIGFPKGLRLAMFSQMIGYTRTGKFFVTGVFNHEQRDFGCRMLGVVDTCTKPMQYTTVLRFSKLIHIARYVPSLFSPSPAEELPRAWLHYIALYVILKN